MVIGLPDTKMKRVISRGPMVQKRNFLSTKIGIKGNLIVVAGTTNAWRYGETLVIIRGMKFHVEGIFYLSVNGRFAKIVKIILLVLKEIHIISQQQRNKIGEMRQPFARITMDLLP